MQSDFYFVRMTSSEQKKDLNNNIVKITTVKLVARLG